MLKICSYFSGTLDYFSPILKIGHILTRSFSQFWCEQSLSVTIILVRSIDERRSSRWYACATHQVSTSFTCSFPSTPISRLLFFLANYSTVQNDHLRPPDPHPQRRMPDGMTRSFCQRRRRNTTRKGLTMTLTPPDAMKRRHSSSNRRSQSQLAWVLEGQV